MPNHVAHRIVFESSALDEEEAVDLVKAAMKNTEHEFDFNVLIPYPPQYRELDLARAKAIKEGASWNEAPRDGFNQGGYEWCIKNWGTKWNAYDVNWDYDAVYLNTAWNTPRPIWEALSKKFPDLTITVEYADEDIGRSCGILRYQRGYLVKETTEMGLADREHFAQAIHYRQSSQEWYALYQKANKRADALEKELKRIKSSMKDGIE